MAAIPDSPAIATRPHHLTNTMKRLAASFLSSHSRKSPSQTCDYLAASTVAPETHTKLNDCSTDSAVPAAPARHHSADKQEDDDLQLLLAHAEATLGELLAKAGASFDGILADENRQCKSVDGDGAIPLNEGNQSVVSDYQHNNYDEFCHDYRHVRRTSSFSRIWKQIGERMFCGCSSAQLRSLVQEMEMELSRSVASGGAPLSAQAEVYFQEEDDIEAYWRSVAETMLNSGDTGIITQNVNSLDGDHDARKSSENAGNVTTTEEITFVKPATNTEVIRKAEKRVTFLLEENTEHDVTEIDVVPPASAVKEHDQSKSSSDGVYSEVKLLLDRVSSRRMNTQLCESPVLSQSHRYRAAQGSTMVSDYEGTGSHTTRNHKNSRGGIKFNPASLSPGKRLVSLIPWPACRNKGGQTGTAGDNSAPRHTRPATEIATDVEPVLPYGAADSAVLCAEHNEAPASSSRDGEDVVQDTEALGRGGGTGRSVPLMVLLHEEKEESGTEYSDDESCMGMFTCTSDSLAEVEQGAGKEDESEDGGEDEADGERDSGTGNVRHKAAGGADPLVCCVCMVARKGAALIPCGHTFCRSCTQQLFVERGACPLCNSLIAQVLHIF